MRTMQTAVKAQADQKAQGVPRAEEDASGGSGGVPLLRLLLQLQLRLLARERELALCLPHQTCLLVTAP